MLREGNSRSVTLRFIIWAHSCYNLCLQDHQALAPLCFHFPLKGDAGMGQAAGLKEKATAVPAEVHRKARELWKQAALVSQAR